MQQNRPSTPSLETQATTLGGFKGDGQNKSTWQSFIDSPGFAKRHPKLALKSYGK
tara:strand:+ start:161 stop:325 length:165 start_codon:yes stop_codon:yes gene_type:complete